MTAEIVYTGDLMTEVTHVKSGRSFVTDAPPDNQGKGSAISPTDMLAASLVACKLTTAAIAFRGRQWAEPKMRGTVNKIMADAPRRVARLEVDIYVESVMPEDQRPIFERACKACPVAKSLHPDIEQAVVFHYA